MKSVLAIDVAKNKSMVYLQSEFGEVYFNPYEINHTLAEFDSLKMKILDLKLKDVTIFMESTSTYHYPVQRYFKENGFDTHVINPIHSKSNTRTLRKTKTDKEDCINLANLFFKGDIKNNNLQYDEIYDNLNSLSRQLMFIDEGLTRVKNRYIQTVNLTIPEASECFKGNSIYGKTALNLFYEFPHTEIIKNKRVDALAYNMANTNNRHLNYYKKKAKYLKELTKNSYPGVCSKSYETQNLLQLITLLKNYTTQKDSLKEKMIALAKQSPLFKSINSIYGIGEYGASLILAELRDITRFDNTKQINAYCGLDPTIIQSGKTINYHGPISKRGNKNARKYLYNACVSIITTSSKNKPDHPIYQYYIKKRSENKHYYESIISCTTKLIRIIYCLCKNNTLFI